MEIKIQWFHYLLAFFAGFFLINSLPHFLNGISGNYFPTPFSNPPGKGLSSPLINVIWGTVNFIAGYIFFRFAKIKTAKILLLIPLFAGGLLMAVILALVLVNKMPY